ncbi:acyltransferase [Paraburkholderia sp. MPAMCS5]|uniref:acyltransferase family protein n=1 Tax=Paraburkholderia sp. MPAMCS5 TaxID=3112563 RepID=UPI002E18EDA8|nr:acyltransferase [Paraburkholderia sp. MPAMCS5]
MNKFVGLDVLRFSLAVYLMVFHSIHQYPQNGTIPFIELSNLGGFATSSFFILSGFILAHVYFGRTTELRGGAREFFVKRLSNLYPVHLISLLLVLLVSAAGTRGFAQFAVMSLDDAERYVTLPPLDTAINFVLNLFLLQVWHPIYGSVNPPSWSLATLFFFYLVFPFFAPRLLKAQQKPRLLVALWLLYLIPPIAGTLMNWYGPEAVGMITRNPLLRLPEFLVGIVLYGLFREGRLNTVCNSGAKKVAAWIFILASFALAAWLETYGPIATRYVIHNGALMPAQVLLVIIFAGVAIPARFSALSVRLGNSALSIFAIHVPIFLVMIKVLKLLSIGKSPLWCASHFSACVAASKEVIPSMATYPLYLIGTVIAAVYFQERLVAPLRDWIRGRFLKRRTCAPAAKVRSAPEHRLDAQRSAGR